MMQRLFERFLKDHQCLEPYFHHNIFQYFEYLMFHSIFANSKLCTSCNSYSLTIFQNYSEVSNIFQKFPVLTVSRIINYFFFQTYNQWRILLVRQFFWFSYIFLTVSPRDTVFSCLFFVDFPVYVETARFEFFK